VSEAQLLEALASLQSRTGEAFETQKQHIETLKQYQQDYAEVAGVVKGERSITLWFLISPSSCSPTHPHSLLSQPLTTPPPLPLFRPPHQTC
jgi:hypothetical protein